MLTRGDSAYISFQLKKADDSIYELQEGDQVIFRFKVGKEITEINCSVDINNHITAVEILPEHTQNLKTGQYKYEVELITFDGKHSTFIADQPFIIGRELEARD
jgi:hypothetical protein